MHFDFLTAAFCGREGGNKKAAASRHAAARVEPIRFNTVIVNRVMRIGAFSWGEPKKLPWKSLRTELIPVKGLFPQRAGQSRPRPDGVHPSFAQIRNRVGTFRGLLGRRVPKRHLTDLVELASYARPRCGEPPERGIAGEVIEQGSMRSGAGREARPECLCSPYKRKAELCPKNKSPRLQRLQPNQPEEK